MRGMTTLPKVTGTISGQRQIPKVGLHQGSVLSPLLFVIVMEMIFRELRAGLPLESLELLYADDLILMAESQDTIPVGTAALPFFIILKAFKISSLLISS